MIVGDLIRDKRVVGDVNSNIKKISADINQRSGGGSTSNCATKEDLKKHIDDINNPHKITIEQINGVPARLSILETNKIINNSQMVKTNLYAHNEEIGGFRISLSDIKELNTKIVDAASLDEIDFSKVYKDDYLLVEK